MPHPPDAPKLVAAGRRAAMPSGRAYAKPPSAAAVEGDDSPWA
jgi:hypothetical protein